MDYAAILDVQTMDSLFHDDIALHMGKLGERAGRSGTLNGNRSDSGYKPGAVRGHLCPQE
jgi:hypothetical protein